MAKHFLEAIKGWPTEAHPDVTAPLSAAAIAAGVKPGMVVRVDPTSGEFELGVGNNKVMPLFLLHGPDDKDVRNNGGTPATDTFPWVSIVPTAAAGGRATALPASGSFELASTEYNPAVAASLVPNAVLTSAAAGGTAGLLTTGTKGTNCLCGVVSRGLFPWDGPTGAMVLAFWPHLDLPN